MSVIKTYAKDIYIVDGLRSPFLKAAGKPNPFSASDLGVAASRQLLMRNDIPDIGEVVTGCVMPSPDETNISRVIALRSGCSIGVPALTVQRNCASGMQAIDTAAEDIAARRYHITLAGGTDSMSRAPLLFSEKMVNWLAKWYAAKSIPQRLGLISQIRPAYFAPVIALLRGLTDPLAKLSMGQTAEILAYKFKITREEMDMFALQSQQRAASAQEAGYFNNEITPLFDAKGQVYDKDTGIRKDTSMAKLAALKPYFDKKFGLVTAGNSAQITDGACFLLLASEEAVKTHNLPVLGRIVDASWAALEPSEMGLGPAFAIPPLLKRNHLRMDDIDYWEINEAFAAQVLACVKVLNDDDYCQQYFGLDRALGQIPMDKLNIDGGAIALGHPVGASGARLVLHLLEILKRTKTRYGIASLCIGGGQGGAMLIENLL